MRAHGRPTYIPELNLGVFHAEKTRLSTPSSTPSLIMATDYFLARKHSGLSDGLETPSDGASPQALRSNPLSSKVTSVLSASYADSDIRDALALLDKKGLENNPETRRQLRLDVQKDVIGSNGDIIREFGHVAEVRDFFHICSEVILTSSSNSNASGLPSRV